MTSIIIPLSKHFPGNENQNNQPITPALKSIFSKNLFNSNNWYKAPSSKDNQTSSVITKASTKPSLTSVKSRNDLIEFSLSKKYQEDNHITTNETSSTVSQISEYEELLLTQERNLPVPISRKNDENFKLLTMKSFKRTSLPRNKSVKKYESEKADYEKDFNNTIEYSLMKKKRVSHSTKKTYVSILNCYSNEGDEKPFPIYIDKDIGIYEYWQEHIIESKADEDVLTDKEQLCLANSYILSEMKEAFDMIAKEGVDVISNRVFNKGIR